MPRDAIGLDIGGANIKAATSSGDALSVPFELWRHPEGLADELTGIRDRWADVTNVAVTMTGEFCDCFHTKRDGVRHILAAAHEAFRGRTIRVWSTRGQFLSRSDASADYLAVAAANWHALGTFAGRLVPEGSAILIDTGSTTTDIVPILDGKPVPLGRTDPDRLRSGELVYTGVRRTPVCALLGERVAAEWFATTNDVYVLLGLLAPEPESRSTADGRPMTADFAHARLSRMLGGDPEVTSPVETRALANRVFERQRALIRSGIEQVVARLTGPPQTLIFSGAGEFLAEYAWDDFATTHGLPRPAVYSLADRNGPACSESACAYALAVLAAEASDWD